MSKFTIVFAVVAGSIFISPQANAQDIYQWDAVAGGDSVIQDGGGTWQTGQSNWYDQTTPANDQNWVDGKDALFGGGAGGAAGAITVSGTVSPNNLTIDPANGGGNYTFSGGTIDIPFVGNEGETMVGITVNATGTTTIGSKVTGASPYHRSSMAINTANSDTSLVLSGGTVGDPIGWAYGLSKTGPGTLELSGTSVFGGGDEDNANGISVGSGKLVISGDVTLADQRNFGVAPNNTADITGSLSSSGAAHVGVEGTVNLTGTGNWTMQGDGLRTLTDGDGDAVLNIRDTAVLEVDRAGGVQTSRWSLGGLVICAGWSWNPVKVGTGTVNQDGGTVSLPVTVAAGIGFDGIVGGQGLLLGGMRSDPTGGAIEATYNLNGGLLYTSGVYNLSGLWDYGPGYPSVVDDPANYNQTAIFNFNGGTLRASQDDSTDPDVVAQGNNHFMGNLTHAWVKEGGAIVDTNTFNASIDQPLEHDPDLGETADGGLRKLGEGTLTLLQESTYTGDTSVEAGVLSVGHAYLDDDSSVSIFSGAMMDLDFAGIDMIAGLTLGGVAQSAGVYNSATAGAFFLGSGSLEVIGGVVTVPGDANGDEVVNDLDLALFEAQFGGTPGGDSADFDGDGDVDLEDFAIMRGNWGFGTGGAPLDGAATPEPATMTVLAIGGLLVIRRRRKA